MDSVWTSYNAVSTLPGVQSIVEEFAEKIEEYAHLSLDDKREEKIAAEKEIELSIYYNQLHPFESVYKPEEMNCLALIGHNDMKP